MPDEAHPRQQVVARSVSVRNDLHQFDAVNGVRTASIVLLLDFFFTTKRLCTVNQSKMEDIHSSLFGIVGLWMSAPSWSMTHTLLDPRAKMSDLCPSVPCSDVENNHLTPWYFLVR